jgi:hypothetical protein
LIFSTGINPLFTWNFNQVKFCCCFDIHQSCTFSYFYRIYIVTVYQSLK